MTYQIGDKLLVGIGQARLTVATVTPTRCFLRWPELRAGVWRDVATLEKLNPRPCLDIIPHPRPENPPYISVRYTDIAPGDVLEVRHVTSLTRNHASGTRTLKTVARISEPLPDPAPFMPFRWRVIVFTDGTTWKIGDGQLVPVFGGPKWEQRNNPALVRYFPAPTNLYRWEGAA